MRRMELIANRSVEREIIEALEDAIPNFYYTLIPVLHGKGKMQYRLDTATWPETNFMLISYLEDDDALVVKSIVNEVKEHFPKEGIKLFLMDAVLF